MNKEFKFLKELCRQLDIPLTDETKQTVAEQKKYARDVHYTDENTFQNLGLYFMAKLRFTRWKGEEKKNLVRLFQRERALQRKMKEKRRKKR